jgi:hypothetical protein
MSHLILFQGCGSGSELDLDPEGQKRPEEEEKSHEILCFEVLDVLFEYLIILRAPFLRSFTQNKNKDFSTFS